MYTYIYIYIQKGTLWGPHFTTFLEMQVFSLSHLIVCVLIYVHKSQNLKNHQYIYIYIYRGARAGKKKLYIYIYKR